MRDRNRSDERRFWFKGKEIKGGKKKKRRIQFQNSNESRPSLRITLCESVRYLPSCTREIHSQEEGERNWKSKGKKQKKKKKIDEKGEKEEKVSVTGASWQGYSFPCAEWNAARKCEKGSLGLSRTLSSVFVEPLHSTLIPKRCERENTRDRTRNTRQWTLGPREKQKWVGTMGWKR